MKWLIGILVLLLIMLQYRLWFGDGSLQQFMALRSEARETHAELLRLRDRNQALEAEVADLKSGLEAIEERARNELGMIDEDETFYQFVKKWSPVNSPAPSPAQSPSQSPATTVGDQSAELGEDDPLILTPAQPIDADGSSAGRPESPDGEQLLAPDVDGDSAQGVN